MFKIEFRLCGIYRENVIIRKYVHNMYMCDEKLFISMLSLWYEVNIKLQNFNLQYMFCFKHFLICQPSVALQCYYFINHIFLIRLGC